MVEIAAKPIELPAFYRLRYYRGRQCLVTLKGEIIREVPARADRERIEALAEAHQELRHWSMVERESRADRSEAGLAFTAWARERLKAAQGEFHKAMSRVEDGAA